MNFSWNETFNTTSMRRHRCICLLRLVCSHCRYSASHIVPYVLPPPLNFSSDKQPRDNLQKSLTLAEQRKLTEINKPTLDANWKGQSSFYKCHPYLNKGPCCPSLLTFTFTVQCSGLYPFLHRSAKRCILWAIRQGKKIIPERKILLRCV